MQHLLKPKGLITKPKELDDSYGVDRIVNTQLQQELLPHRVQEVANCNVTGRECARKMPICASFS